MGRSSTFPAVHGALQTLASVVHPLPGDTTGPLTFLNPTNADFVRKSGSDGPITAEAETSHRVKIKWSSRNQRKGRHVISVKRGETVVTTPPPSRSIRIRLRNIGRMLTWYPYWDISWLVAYIFTWGSIVWVINGFFVWLPAERPDTEFKTEVLYGGGITAFIGATIFTFGSILLMLEAVNENRDRQFGWAVQQLFAEMEQHEHDAKEAAKYSLHPREYHGERNHRNKTNTEDKENEGVQPNQDDTETDSPSWTWWPASDDLKHQYIYELGFWACFIQLLAASIFWISGFTALPGIYNKLSPGAEAGVFWTPQVIGGSGFIISGFLFMIETQKNLWMPAFDKLGWYIGFCNMIGGWGFMLCPAFGYSTAKWAQYQSTLSTFWGGWAFLIGSLIQLYESLDKYPVEVEK